MKMCTESSPTPCPDGRGGRPQPRGSWGADGAEWEWKGSGSLLPLWHAQREKKTNFKHNSTKYRREDPEPVILTPDKTVNLDQSDVVMVDVTVFKQAPELQAGQQKGAMWRVGTAKSAVELIDRPQLCAVYQHLELHLSQMRCGIRPGGVAVWTAWTRSWPVHAQVPALSLVPYPAASQCSGPCLLKRCGGNVRCRRTDLNGGWAFCKCCSCLPHRGMRGRFPVRLSVIIWSLAPSKTRPSVDVNFPCAPNSITGA